MSDSSMPVGNAHEQSLSDIWNGEDLRKLRQNMLIGQPSAECNRCYQLEDGGVSTLRLHSNATYQHHRYLVETTDPQGFSPMQSMAYMDIRWSNICNLRCRTCGHDLSSGWYDDTKTLQADYDKPRIISLDREGNVWQQLEPLLHTVEEVYFAGGESLVTEEHYRLLDHWISHGHTDVRLRYTTNFTMLRYKDRPLFDLWKHFNDVRLSASLDGSHDRGEYLRKNLSWSQVIQNRRLMIDRAPHVRFELTPTVSLINVLHLPDFHREWILDGLVHADHLRLNVLSHPAHTSCQTLPQHIKSRATERIESHVAWLGSIGATEQTCKAWSQLITFMHSDDTAHLLPNFVNYTQQMDQIRQEDFSSIFPELRDLYEI